MKQETIKSIMDDLTPTMNTLLDGCSIKSEEEGVIVEGVGEIAEGFLMRVAEKHLVSLTIVEDKYFFNEMPYIHAKDFLFNAL